MKTLVEQETLEMIIVRTLFDIDENGSRIYQLHELDNSERHFLDIVRSTGVRISSVKNDDHTELTYSIL